MGYLKQCPPSHRELKVTEPEKKPSPRGIPAAEAISLAGLVDYQEGSVVSRTIVRKETGTVTLFAFDEGQGLSEHTAPFDALVHLLEGEADITISGRTLRVRQHEIVLMPANQPHALHAVRRFKMLLTMIRS